MKKSLKKIRNIDVVLYALLKLGGITRKVHTEDIAWVSYTLAKERFSWSLNKFRKRGFPDKTTARYTLESAKKIGLVKGRAGRDKGGEEKEGWQFTPKGVNWIVKNQEDISEALNLKSSSQLMPIHKAQRIIKKIKSHKTFVNFERNNSLKEISEYDFIDLLNCSPDAPRKVIKSKFDLLKNSINLTGDKELKKFVSKAEKKFSILLSKNDLP